MNLRVVWRLRLFGVALGLVAIVAGCATTGGLPVAAPGTGPSPPGDRDAEPRRVLFRIGYQGPAGSGSMRLALFDLAPGAYQARASDSFGRGLWSLELAAGGATFVDHRRRQYCLSGGEMRIPELALGALPLERLPDVLGGRMPAVPSRATDSADDFVDLEGRRWTGSREDGELAAWTLWSEERPLLWWRRAGGGGILSHREGAQFRWRQTVSEALASAPPALVVPEPYAAVDCAELTAAAPPP